MKNSIDSLIVSFNTLLTSHIQKRNRFIFVLLSGSILLTFQQARSNEIYLKCIGKYEIDRGALIKPDWETSYLKINLDGLISKISDKGIKKEARTLNKGNYYIITHSSNKNNLINVYKINKTHNTFTVKYPQKNRTLIGTCQKGRG